MSAEDEHEQRRKTVALIRTVIGYLLFAGVVVYSVSVAPKELWHIDPVWLFLSVAIMPVMMLLQTAQVAVFLRAHGVPHGWYWPMLFSAKKGTLNAVLPARTGTFVLMYMLTRHYPVKWHEYLRFSVVAGLVSLVISGLAVAWLFLSSTQFILVLPVLAFVGWFAIRRYPSRYFSSVSSLLLIAAGIFLAMLAGFWGVLSGIGYHISLTQAFYFATASNALAQAALTPGNMGVREFVMGGLAPYIALPMAAGVVAGAVFHVVRTSTYACIMMLLQALPHFWPHRFGATQVPDLQRTIR